jgi:hypothetical protein
MYQGRSQRQQADIGIDSGNSMRSAQWVKIL